MARRLPDERFAEVVAASAAVFVSHGFRRAQVQDVADVLGVSKGSLYRYADGKLALFTAALRYADGVEPEPHVSALPVPAATEGELADLVRGRLASQVTDLALTRALLRDEPEAGGLAPLEFAGIVEDLYRRLSANRTAIKLVDRCAPEFSELRQVWFVEGRSLQVDALADYLRQRSQTGQLSVPGPVDLVARSMVELCALWAVHRHWDPAAFAAGTDGPRSAKPTTGVAEIDEEAVVSMLTEAASRWVTGRPAGGTGRGWARGPRAGTARMEPRS